MTYAKTSWTKARDALKQMPAISPDYLAVWERYPPGGNEYSNTKYNVLAAMEGFTVPNDSHTLVQKLPGGKTTSAPMGLISVAFGLPFDQNYKPFRLYYNSIIKYVEDTQNNFIKNNNWQIIANDAQNFINFVIGTEKISLQDQLNKLKNAAAAYVPIKASNTSLASLYKRYDGTSWAAGSSDPAQSISYANALQKFINNVKALITLKQTAEYTVQAQAQKKDELTREKDQALNIINALIAQVSGEAQKTYSNQVTNILSLSLEPQVVGLNALIPEIELTIVSQTEQLLLNQMAAALQSSADIENQISALINTIQNTQRANELRSILNSLATNENNPETRLTQATDLLRETTLAAKLDQWQRTLNEINKLLDYLPESLANSMYEELQAIVKNTNITVAESLELNTQRLLDFLPKVQATIAGYTAIQAEQKIQIDENARNQQIQAILSEEQNQTKIELLNLQQEALAILPQLDESLTVFFENLIQKKENVSTTDKLIFFRALMPQLLWAQSIQNTLGSLSSQDITGIKTEVTSILGQWESYMAGEVYSQQADQIAQPATTTTGTGGFLPLLLGAISLYSIAG